MCAQEFGGDDRCAAQCTCALVVDSARFTGKGALRSARGPATVLTTSTRPTTVADQFLALIFVRLPLHQLPMLNRALRGGIRIRLTFRAQRNVPSWAAKHLLDVRAARADISVFRNLSSARASRRAPVPCQHLISIHPFMFSFLSTHSTKYAAMSSHASPGPRSFRVFLCCCNTPLYAKASASTESSMA